jgi:ABC-type uncharacterized transport system permease subunit
VAELLFWPALLAYGEAAVAYFHETRAPGRPGRLATWGIRIGWLLQTALLIAQAARAEGFPWSTWAGSLNLFVWLVVTAYLIWGCRARFRLLGLVVAPIAAGLFVVARLGGGTELGDAQPLLELSSSSSTSGSCSRRSPGSRSRPRSPRSTSSRSGGSSGTTRRSSGCPRRRSRRSTGSQAATILFSLPALTLGIARGLVRLEEDGGGLDALMAVTLATWVAYGSYLALRYGYGWRGRRTAYLALGAFALVVVVRLALPATHFA